MNKAVLLRDRWIGADRNLNKTGSDIGECRTQCAHQPLLGETGSNAVFTTGSLGFTFQA
jgi:hypothetical protein